MFLLILLSSLRLRRFWLGFVLFLRPTTNHRHMALSKYNQLQSYSFPTVNTAGIQWYTWTLQPWSSTRFSVQMSRARKWQNTKNSGKTPTRILQTNAIMLKQSDQNDKNDQNDENHQNDQNIIHGSWKAQTKNVSFFLQARCVVYMLAGCSISGFWRGSLDLIGSCPAAIWRL